MEFLSVNGSHITDTKGKPVLLRGVSIGGWMNMEDFINGYPGSEEGLRETMADTLGKVKAGYFFERMLDYIFSEKDAQFLAELGMNLVRLPLNYRRFEDDLTPFSYKEAAFLRLDRALDWCEKHGLYAILDMHAVQGWQNSDWHCDNSSRHSLFWKHSHFQDRFIALWLEIAARYKDRAAVAGYDLMNEPICNVWRGRFTDTYEPDWSLLNNVYRRTVNEIRKVDPKHIIYLEGDNFSTLFSGMEPPFAENLVYSSHNYIESGLSGSYPGHPDNFWINSGKTAWWDKEKQREIFFGCEGAVFAKKYNVPLWVSEFGSAYNGPPEKVEDRLRSLDDQLDIFGEFGASWAIWTYKDLGTMASLKADPESDYMQLIKPVLEKKELLNSHFGVSWLPPNATMQKLHALADDIGAIIDMPHIHQTANRKYLGQSVFSEFAAIQLQPAYAQCFKGMTEQRLDEVLSAFALDNCVKNTGLLDLFKKHLGEKKRD